MPKKVMTFTVISDMTADANWRWKAEGDCTLIHVSANSSNAYAAGITIGTSEDADEFMTKKSVGVSNTPAEFDWDDFATYSNKAYPRIEKGDIVIVDVDYNYNAGGGAQASANLTVILTFLEG